MRAKNHATERMAKGLELDTIECMRSHISSRSRTFFFRESSWV